MISSCSASNETVSNEPVNLTSNCYIGGTIYTAIDANPTVSALKTEKNRITDLTSENVDTSWCGNSKVTDLKGATLFPGFTDAHAHLLGIGLREMTLNLEGTKSIEDLKKRLYASVETTPKGQTIYGRGWIETHWPDERFPNKNDLDMVAPDNPVILERADGHAVVVNSAALKAAGITKDTQSPFGGDILRDSNGDATGMLIDKASDLVMRLLPRQTEGLRERAYSVGAKLYASRGWTNVHAMSVDRRNVPIMKKVAQSGELPLRVYNSLDITEGFDQALFDSSSDAPIQTRAIKLYSDGALGSRGAALLEPYDDDPDNIGLMLTTRDKIMPILETALKNGIQVNTHAIGDKANRLVLDWYEDAYKAVPEEARKVKTPRWRIEHTQIVHLDDLPRYAEMGIIPSMQPSHAIGDFHFAVDRIGPKRLVGGYAWRSLIDSGAIIAGGSDAPVEVGDPRIEFYAAVTRKDLTGFSNENWYPGQKVTRQEALKMFTIWPAHAAFQETDLGTIEVGKLADFTIFDKDIMTIANEDIMSANVIMTVLDGEIVYKAP